jgi:hypothetical protein
MAYGVGLINDGYRHSPLEEMAFELQAEFDRGMVWNNLIGIIERRTDGIWSRVASLLPPS